MILRIADEVQMYFKQRIICHNNQSNHAAPAIRYD